MIVLGIDPGLANTGWAILEKNDSLKLISYGCLKTKKNKDFSLRLEKIYKSVKKLIKKYKPNNLAIEEIFFAKNVKTAIQVSQVMGVIKLAGKTAKMKITGYTPLNIKTAITGYGRAEKSQVQYMVSRILKIKRKIKPDHAADAVAVALTHLQTNTTLKGI